MAVPARPVSGQPIETTWGDIAHDTAVAIDYQTGTATLPAAGAATSQVAVVFPRAFAAPPVVFLTGRDANACAQPESVVAVSATQFTAQQRHRSDSNVLAAGFSWVAIGPRV